jgi:thioredoxin reductase
VVIIGGSDVAMDQARWLRARGARVEVLVRRRLRAPGWLAEAALREGVLVSLGATAIHAQASASVVSLTVRQHGETTERHVGAVVSAIGRKAVVLEGAEAAMAARPSQIRVVGDGTGRRARHVVAALGDGCVAAAELLALAAGGSQ